MGDLGDAMSERGSLRASLPSPKPTISFWQSSAPNEMVNYRSTPELPSISDVIVIGTGITSVFAVRELLETSESMSKPINILVLDARTICSGATGRNGGHLQPIVHDQDPEIIAFELRNFSTIESLIAEKGIPCYFRKLPGCIAFWNPIYFAEAKEALEKANKKAPQYSELTRIVEDSDELDKLRLRGAVGAIVQSMAASLSPYKLVTWLWQEMVERFPAALNLQTTTPVTKVVPVEGDEAGYAVHTHRGIVKATNVVLATNGYTSYLLPSFEDAITPAQAQMSALRPTPTFSKHLLDYSYGYLGVGLQDRVMSDYLVQNPLSSGGHFMFGGGRSEVPGHGVGVSDDGYVDPHAEKYLRNLPKLMDLDSRVAEGESSRPDGTDSAASQKLHLDGSWTGIMGYSKDHLPWVGGVPDQQGLWVSAGYTGHGMTNASGCGQHLAKLVLAAIDGKDWRTVEEQSVADGTIPKEYLISRTRMGKARIR